LRPNTRVMSSRFPPSRLSDIETKGVVPSIYRLYSLSVIYRKDAREILTWYGVDMNKIAEDIPLASPPKSHKSEALENVSSVQIPVRMDPSFDPRYTVNMGTPGGAMGCGGR